MRARVTEIEQKGYRRNRKKFPSVRVSQKQKAPTGRREEQTQKTQDELQWIVAQRLLSTLTIPGFS